ncbi:hypothetical protein H2509_20650 [Stappia sp. F7233]|uniref:Uncharacterized protein n=1 Tax=Stappia albiluteola TaxID=2758565 RepID=A0A839AKJ0_9HYPH|nr:hypothetical protein [Stappia albiluteola]MBA5779548.1 hypothetical protein [Stappia albiluteola]
MARADIASVLANFVEFVSAGGSIYIVTQCTPETIDRLAVLGIETEDLEPDADFEHSES